MEKDYIIDRLGPNRYIVSEVPIDSALMTYVVPKPLTDHSGKTREFFSYSEALAAARADLEASE